MHPASQNIAMHRLHACSHMPGAAAPLITHSWSCQRHNCDIYGSLPNKVSSASCRTQNNEASCSEEYENMTLGLQSRRWRNNYAYYAMLLCLQVDLLCSNYRTILTLALHNSSKYYQGDGYYALATCTASEI